MTDRQDAPLSESEIEELQRLDSRATPPEWCLSEAPSNDPQESGPLTGGIYVVDGEDATDIATATDLSEDDLILICKTRNALPRMLTELTASRSRIAELEGELARYEEREAKWVAALNLSCAEGDSQERWADKYFEERNALQAEVTRLREGIEEALRTARAGGASAAVLEAMIRFHLTPTEASHDTR